MTSMETCIQANNQWNDTVCQSNFGSAGRAAPLSSEEMDLIILNLQNACQIHKPWQFFTWSQGMLQSLVNHELLLCFSPVGENTFSRHKVFSMHTEGDGGLENFQKDEIPRLERLLKYWRQNHCEALLIDINDELLSESTLKTEMHRLDSELLLLHGVSAPNGKIAGLYLFMCNVGKMRTRQAYLAELIVPVLHAALMRTRVDLPGVLEGQAEDGGEIRRLTRREHEVLQWICQGKSNLEIGLILGISRLTVKNHVQEILRRLNVMNRAQAAAKGLTLNLIRNI